MFVASGGVGSVAGAAFDFGGLLGKTSRNGSRAGVPSECVGKKAMTVYETYINVLNADIKRQFEEKIRSILNTCRI